MALKRKLALFMAGIMLVQGLSPALSVNAGSEDDLSEETVTEYADEDENAPEEMPGDIRVPDDMEFTTAAAQWPSDTTTLNCGSFNTLYASTSGEGYPFAFWLENDTDKNETSESIKEWKYSDIRIRIDGADCYSVNWDRGTMNYNLSMKKTYFGAGFLKASLSTGEHTIDVAVSRNKKWYSGTVKLSLTDEGKSPNLYRYSEDTKDRWNCFSAKAGNSIFRANMPMYRSSETDKITRIGLKEHKTGEEVWSGRDVSKDFDWGKNVDQRYYSAYSLESIDNYLYYCLVKSEYMRYIEYDMLINKDISEGWYDMFVETESGIKTTYVCAYYATKDPVILNVGYDIRKDYGWSGKAAAGDLLFPASGGDYVAAYVYGLNIPKTMYPVYYNGDQAVTDTEDIKSERLINNWGYQFMLGKKDSEVWDGEGPLDLTAKLNGVTGAEGRREVKVSLSSLYGKGYEEKTAFLSAEWADDASEIGVIAFDKDEEKFRETCDPVIVDDLGNVMISWEQSLESNQYLNYYRIYRIVNNKSETVDDQIEYYNNDIKICSDYTVNGIYAVFPLNDVKALVTGNGNGRLADLLTDEQKASLSEYGIVRVVTYLSNGTVTDKVLFDSSFAGGKPVKTYTISFDANGGSGTMESISEVSGEFVLPECSFTAPEGKTFDKWKVKNYEYDPGDKIRVTSDLTVTALWKDAGIASNEAMNPVPDINEKTAALYLVKGQKFTLPESGWISEKKKIVSISKKNLLSAKKETTEPVKLVNGDRTMDVYVSKLAMGSKTITLEAGEVMPVKFEYDAKHYQVLWYSGTPDVATVTQDGKVSALSKGTSVITAFVNGCAFTCKVKVKESTAAAQERPLHLFTKASKNISLKGVKKTVWTADDESIVKIKGKKITALAAGSTTLRTEYNGKHYSIRLYVEDPEIKTDGILPDGRNKYKLTLKQGSKKEIVFAKMYQDVVFKSNKGECAYVDDKLVINTNRPGKAKLTAKVNGKTITVNVTVQ